MKYNIREIEEKDNKEVENVIRACLIEFSSISLILYFILFLHKA